jgi:CO/xanthine dehydrogenase Mo-binding subunit
LQTPARFIRPDGLEKVTGQAYYTADLKLPGMLEGQLLLAKHPHARIRRLDTARARSTQGVLAVVTQADVPQVRYGSAVKDRTLFADGIVRFEGEVVAAVAALDPKASAAALDAIEVEYDVLPPVTDPELALISGSHLVHPEWQTYSALDGIVRSGNDCAHVTIAKGDIDAGFADADDIIEERYVCDQSHPVPIEPHAIVAQWSGERVTIWSTSQVPFAARA